METVWDTCNRARGSETKIGRAFGTSDVKILIILIKGGDNEKIYDRSIWELQSRKTA